MRVKFYKPANKWAVVEDGQMPMILLPSWTACVLFVAFVNAIGANGYVIASAIASVYDETK